MKARIFSYAFFAAVMAMMIGAIQNDSAGLANMAAVSIWAFSLFGCFGGVMAILLAAGVSHAEGEARDKLLTTARDVIDKTTYSTVRRTFSWLMSIAIFLTAAYAGLIGSAVIYAIAVALTQLGRAWLKSSLEAFDAKQAEAQA